MNWTTIEDAIFDWIKSTSGLADSQILWEKQGYQRPTGPWIGIRAGIKRRGIDWVDVKDKILSVADQNFTTVDTATDRITVTGHPYVTGDGPFRLTTTGTLPGGLATTTDYWIVVVDANTISLAATFPNSVAASPTLVDITDAGSGTHTIAGTSTTARAGQEISATVRGPRMLTISLQCYGGGATGSTRPAAILHDVITKSALPSVADALTTAGIAIASFSEVNELDIVLGPVTDSRGILTVFAHIAEEITEDATYIETVAISENPPIS